MKLRIRKVLTWFGLATFVVNFSLCYAEQGTVTDEVTGKPIVGAQIVVYWSGRVPSPVQSSEACFRLMATTSDVNGKFDIPALSGNFNPLLQRRLRPVSVVARGYRSTPKTEYQKLVFSMRPLADPKIEPEKAEEDRKYVHSDSVGGPCEDPRKLTLPYLKVWYQNLELLANSDADREALIGYLANVDSLEFGDRIAEKNSLARRLEFSAVRRAESGKLEQNKDGKK